MLRALARFGFQRLEPADETTVLRPLSAVNSAVKPFYDARPPAGLDELYELVVDGKTFVLPSAPAAATGRRTTSPTSTSRFPAGLVDLRLGVLTVADAVAQGL